MVFVGGEGAIHFENGVFNKVVFWGEKGNEKEKKKFGGEENENERTGKAGGNVNQQRARKVEDGEGDFGLKFDVLGRGIAVAGTARRRH
jgi:hypothetical protein